MDAIRVFAEDIIKRFAPPEIVVAATLARSTRQYDRHLTTIHTHAARIRSSQTRTERMLGRLLKMEEVKDAGVRYQETLPQDKEEGLTALDLRSAAAALAVVGAIAAAHHLKSRTKVDNESVRISADSFTADGVLVFTADKSITFDATNSGTIIFKADHITILRDDPAAMTKEQLAKEEADEILEDADKKIERMPGTFEGFGVDPPIPQEAPFEGIDISRPKGAPITPHYGAERESPKNTVPKTPDTPDSPTPTVKDGKQREQNKLETPERKPIEPAAPFSGSKGRSQEPRPQPVEQPTARPKPTAQPSARPKPVEQSRLSNVSPDLTPQAEAVEPLNRKPIPTQQSYSPKSQTPQTSYEAPKGSESAPSSGQPQAGGSRNYPKKTGLTGPEIVGSSCSYTPNSLEIVGKSTSSSNTVPSIVK